MKIESILTFGIPQADAFLGGGLRPAALHEAYGEREDAAAAMALALLVAWHHHTQLDRADAGPILWARAFCGFNRPYGPGLAELGIDPQALTLLMLPDSRAVLRAALDAVRQGAAGSVLIELGGRQPLLDLTATRRLALAAQDSGTMVWLIRAGAQAMPSAAQTRWRVAPAPAGEAGRPTFALTLLRQRGGPDGLQFSMEWDRDTASFQPAFDTTAPLSQPVPAVAAG